jgi:RNA recognition motif-containing protein
VILKFGKVESVRVLTHKNCGFVNFENVQDAIKARDACNGKEIHGAFVKIGFAKVPRGEVTREQALANPGIVAGLAKTVIEKGGAWIQAMNSPTVMFNNGNLVKLTQS